MSDIADDANEYVEAQLQAALANNRQKLEKQPRGGQCLNCAEPLSPNLRFCDEDCRDDYEKRSHLK